MPGPHWTDGRNISALSQLRRGQLRAATPFMAWDCQESRRFPGRRGFLLDVHDQKNGNGYCQHHASDLDPPSPSVVHHLPVCTARSTKVPPLADNGFLLLRRADEGHGVTCLGR
jgi:hypothetical protein